jgi:hypothetical protein
VRFADQLAKPTRQERQPIQQPAAQHHQAQAMPRTRPSVLSKVGRMVRRASGRSSEHAIPLEAYDSDDDDYNYKKEDWFGLVDPSDELECTICRLQDLSAVEMTGQRVRLTFQTWADATKWLNGIGSAP